MNFPVPGYIKKVAQNFEDWPDLGLSVALVAAGVAILALAVFSHSKVAKAVALAYILLP